MTWEEIEQEWKEWDEMPYRPTKEKLPDDAVIDEDKSVRWNREEVKRLNNERKAEYVRLQNLKGQKGDEVYEHIYQYIMGELGKRCTHKKAEAIFSYAYELGHANDLSDIYDHLIDVMHLARLLLGNE